MDGHGGKDDVASADPSVSPVGAPRRHSWVEPVTVVGVVVLMAAASFLLVAVTSLSQQKATARMEHVHAIGLNPADRSLYAATHRGLFRVSGESVSRVGPDRDLMGFAVTGPDRFLASGHPAQAKRGEGLGVVESSDAGRTWATTPLATTVDLHALAARPGYLYGFDAASRTLLASTDGRRWQRRATLSVTDVTVSPANPRHLLATTPDGLARSWNGGRSFQAVIGPPLAFLSWAGDGTVFGIDPNGGVHLSRNGGSRWQTRASLEGLPEALEATDDGLYAATAGGISVSRDQGRTFALVVVEDR